MRIRSPTPVRESRQTSWRLFRPRKMVHLPDTDSGVYVPGSTPDVELLPLDPDTDQSHHVLKNGEQAGFKNPWPSWRGAGLADVLGAFKKGAVLKDVPKDGEREEFEKNGRLVKVRRPDWSGGDGVRVCWLGHASVMVRVPRRRLGGEGEQGMVGVIFDPMFSKR